MQSMFIIAAMQISLNALRGCRPWVLGGKLAVAPLKAHNAHKPKLVVMVLRKLANHLI